MADLNTLLVTVAGVATGNPNAWDISKAYYDAGVDAWDVSKAVYSSISFSVNGEDTAPGGLFFKPDGTKMYMAGTTGDDINEYTLSTPWLVSSATYVQNFSVSAQDSSPNDVFFKSDGTKMYVVGSGSDSVYEYDLSTAWDISTASYVQSFSVATEEATPTGLFFKSDGTKMYVIGLTGDDVNEYDLSTPWDISTASYLQNFSVAAQETNPQGVSFKSDGTKMYVIGSTGDDVNEYDLSTAWDVSSASYLQNFSIAGQQTIPTGLFFNPNGSTFYVIGTSSVSVHQYTIGGFSVAAQETAPEELFFKPDGTKLYVMGRTGDDVNEYDLSSAWDITTASYLQVFSVAAKDTFPTGMFFKGDGTKMYISGAGSGSVHEYDLSSAWDVSSATFLQSFSVSAKETNPNALSFKVDGTKMYVGGPGSDSVHEYDLSTAWDISSASFLQSLSVLAYQAFLDGVVFKPDGTKMYTIGSTQDEINEFDLATAWNISTASYVQLYKVAADPKGMFFKPDGEQFWIIDPALDKVFSYSISPE